MNKTALRNAEHDDDNYWNLIEADSEECNDARGTHAASSQNIDLRYSVKPRRSITQ